MESVHVRLAELARADREPLPRETLQAGRQALPPVLVLAIVLIGCSGGGEDRATTGTASVPER
jgi:hypothetical protein